MNRVNVGATIEQQRHHVCRSADDRTVQRMTASAVDVVNERWLLIEEGAYARQLAGFGGVMDRMILGHGRRHEPSRRINHVRGIILAAAISRGPTLRVCKLSSFVANGLERRVRKPGCRAAARLATLFKPVDG